MAYGLRLDGFFNLEIKTMKKIFTLLALTISFCMNAQSPAILSDGSSPSLNSGISAAEVRSLIGVNNATITLTAGTGLSGGGSITLNQASNETVTFTNTAVGLATVNEDGNTGQRLVTSDAAYHGDIGNEAVDLSFSNTSGTSKGAKGDYSTAMGANTIASGDFSTAMGDGTTASGKYSIAMGYSSTASTFYSTAIGRTTTASGVTSTAMGFNTTASGSYSTAMGSNTTARDYGSLVIGQYNSSGNSVTGSATSFSASNTAFVIGKGTSNGNRSDAFKVMFNGDATIGNDLTVSGDVVVSSDARLKANIVSLGSTLSRLLLIDGKTYTMKKDGKQKIGVLAQDIREVFPELVSEDANEMLAVNYQGLVPVLINALKEQDGKMNQQQSEIDELKEMVKQLISNK